MATAAEAEQSFDGLTWPDYLVIVLYFVFVLAVGLFSSWKSKRDSVEGYFLSSRSMHFIPVGASLFASNIGSGHFIGLAGSGAASGIGISMFELTAIYYLLMLGWLFVPVYMASGVYTMPEYLRKRFGGQRIRVYLSVLALLLYVFTKISADLYAGALFITQSTKLEGEWAIYIAVLILLAIACTFTVTGGLTAVIWTDFVQTVLMIAGALALSGIGFYETGGYTRLVEQYFNAVALNRSYVDPDDPDAGLCGEVPHDAMHLFRSAKPGESDLPWTGMIFGLAINSIWYWCSDQVIVQRSLSSKNMTHAKGGTVFAGYLKLLPLWIMVFPGMASRVLFPNTVACASPETCEDICMSKAGCTNLAFIMLVNEKMPTGLRGLMLAVMLAALMSSLTSIFNSASTIFTMDLYKRFRKNATESELLFAGRAFVIVLVAVSIIWIPIINASQGSQLFDYIQAVTSYLAPPICAIYLLAIFWPRCNEPGAFWGLFVGLIAGLIRFGLEFGYQKPPCGAPEEDLPPEWWYKLVDNVHYLHFALILWGVTGIVCIVVSICTKPIPEDHLYRLTFWSRKSTKVRKELDRSDRRREEEGGEEDDDRQGGGSLSEEERRRRREDKAKRKAKEAAGFLREDPWWKNFVDVNACLIVVVTVFVFAFFF